MYYIVYGLFYGVSLLPLWFLYLISDAGYFVIYHIIGYRKKVVYSNLDQAFPDKTKEEKKRIAKQFYRNFTDNFIEFLKLISASPDYIKKRFTGDFSLVQDLFDQKKKVELLLSHNFNWEWAGIFIQMSIRHLFLIVYMPIGNKIFDRIFIKVRGKVNAALLPATDLRRAIIPYRNVLSMLVLVADQNPGNPANAFWVNFFGKPTPFVTGPESGARAANTVVMFGRFLKKKRGHYELVLVMLAENPSRLQKGELTKKYVHCLEEFISENPELWLWSHRRWKWDWKEEYGKILE